MGKVKISFNDLIAMTLVVGSCLGMILQAWESPFTFDEHHTWNIINAFKDYDKSFSYFWSHETQLPLFYLLGLISSLIDKFSSFFLRLPSLIFWIAGLLIFFIDTNRKRSLLSLCFLVGAPVVWRQAYLFRPYGLLFLLSTIVTFLFLSISDKNTIKRRVMLGIALFLLSLSHYYGALLSVVILFLLLWKKLKRVKMGRILVVALIFLLLITLLIGGHYYTNFFDPKHTYRSLPSFLSFFGIIKLLFPHGVALGAFCYLLIKNFKKHTKENFELLQLIVFSIAGSLFYSFFISPVFEARYLIIILPAVSLLAGNLITPYLRKKQYHLFFLFFCLWCAVTSAQNSEVGQRRKVDFKEALSKVAPGQRLVLVLRTCPHMFLVQKKFIYQCVTQPNMMSLEGRELYLFVHHSYFSYPHYIEGQYDVVWKSQKVGHSLTFLRRKKEDQ